MVRAMDTTTREVMHRLLREHGGHYRQCVARYVVREEEDREIARDANDGGTKLLIPEHLGAPSGAGERATVEAIDRLARTFATDTASSQAPESADRRAA